ncbi:MAG: hypothetical protein LKI39_04795 [Bacteroides sp.]|jgi:hypothetical protein|nr:hypothetical protein [Bacteroides sp.]
MKLNELLIKQYVRYGLPVMGWSLLLLFCLSCSDELKNQNTPNGSDGTVVSLALSYKAMTESGSSVKTVTRSTDEESISNLCVFQFSGTMGPGSTLLKQTYLSGLSATDGSRVEVFLSSSSSCFLYVCANAGDLTEKFTVGTSTFQDLMDASLSVSGENDFNIQLPMDGASSAFNANTQTTDLPVTLEHLVAKVTYICDLSALPSGATLVITSATLRNVPQSASYVAPVSGVTTTTETTSYIGTGTTDMDAKTTTYVWYQAENLRGTGSTVTTWTERIAKNAPSYASYIELRGDYTPYSGAKTYPITYVLYLGNGTDVNNYDVSRNHHYTVTSQIKGVDLSDLRMTTDINLSADGLSNCYLVGESDQWYRFSGTIRGNGNTKDYTSTYTGISIMPSKVSDSAPDAVTIPSDQIADAVIVWETSEGLLDQVHWDASSDCVKFKTGDITAGNALIAVRNDAGTILWSWHIWRTTFDLAELNRSHTLRIKTNTNYSWYGALVGTAAMRERDLIMMDRNLGASGTDWETNKGVNCLHYQFGRKDPLPGGSTVESEGDVDASNNIMLYGYGSGTLSSSFTIANEAVGTTTLRSESCNTAQNTIDYTIQHPEAFIYNDITSTDDTYNTNLTASNWIYTALLNSSDWKISNCLWGDNNLADGDVNGGYLDPDPWDGDKTIYDPCPAGWRVAPADVFTGVAHDITNGQTGNSDYGWRRVNITNIYNDGWSTGWIFRFGSEPTDTNSYFPASGVRNTQDGVLRGVGFYSTSWLSSPGGIGLYGSIFYGTSDLVFVAGLFRRAFGIPVRCVQE